MAIKTILDVEVNDKDFKRFKELFDEYNQALDKTPEGMEKVSAKMGGWNNRLAGIIAKMNIEQRQHATILEKQDRLWHGISTSTKSVAANIYSATTSLLRWASLTSVFTGLVGAGSLFGIDKLASSVGAGRRSSSGLGLSYGEQKSFETNFGTLVDPGRVLSGVSESLTDITKRYPLYGAGLNEGDIAGQSTGQVSVKLLDKLKDIADNTDPKFYAQVIQARGLGSLTSAEDLRRLHDISPADLAALKSRAEKDVGAFGLEGQTQKAWQDFSVQMSRAGQEIENVFVKGLTELIGPLNNLSQSFVKATKDLLSNPHLGEWITTFGNGIEHVAEYMATDKFQSDVKNFVDGVGKLADALMKIVGTSGDRSGSGGTGIAGIVNRATSDEHANKMDAYWDRVGKGNLPSPVLEERRGALSRWSNPANLRKVGGHGFQTFSSPSEGIRAAGHQLDLYYNRDKLDTIEGIISKYAPLNENDTEGYIKYIEGQTGHGRNDHLNLKDKSEMANLLAGILNKEQGTSRYKPQSVVTILNNTGGNANVTVSQLPQ